MSLTQFMTGADGCSVTVTLNDMGDWLFTCQQSGVTVETFTQPRADEHNEHGITWDQMRTVAIKTLQRLRDESATQ